MASRFILQFDGNSLWARDLVCGRVLVVPQLLLLLLAHVVFVAAAAGAVVVGNIEHLTSVAIESPIGQQKQLYWQATWTQSVRLYAQRRGQ